MANKIIERAKRGDLEGLHLGAIVRMSEEINEPDVNPSNTFQRPRYGSDIKGRDVQEEDCGGYITSLGGILVFTYQEPDTSAWKRKRIIQPDGTVVWRVERPVFEGALDDLKRGTAPNGSPLDGLVVYDLDRLTRDLRHLEDAIDVVMHYGRPILDTTGSVDLLTENGRSTARIMVTMAGNQSAAASRRVKRKHGAMQQAGIPTGGRRPFGWLADKRTLHPEESKLLRDAALKVIDGKPMTAVVLDWVDQGIVTPTGKKWEYGSLKAVFRNPRICGYRARVVKTYDTTNETVSQHMEIVLDADGNPVMGQWDGIITIEQWETLMGMIGRRGTPEGPKKGKNSRIYLLTGTMRCGICDEKLVGIKSSPKYSNKTPGWFYYGCRAKSAGGCSGVSISGPPVDQLMEQAVIAKFEEEAARNAAQPNGPQQTWDGEARLKEIKEDQAEAQISRRKPDGKGISAARYYAIIAELESEENELLASRRAWLARGKTKSKIPAAMRAEWKDYSLPEKRAYIEESLLAVILKPATGGLRGKYKERIEPVWRIED